MATDDAARHQRAQAIGLFRYQLISPALDPNLGRKARGRLVRSIAAQTHVDPFGDRVSPSRDTLDRWIRAWRADGFDALIPAVRKPGPRTDQASLDLAAALKRENPARTVAQVARIVRASTGWSPSESTLLRHFHRLELMSHTSGATEVFGRFEADNPNDRWTGDALHGPVFGGRKTYLFAFLDDHSRLIVGYRFGYSEDTLRLASALEPALASRGIPASAYVDNGSAFVDEWLLRACATLGIRLVHSTPSRPQGRGKIERFFRTVRDQFLVEAPDMSAEDMAAAGTDHAGALAELNRLFTAWIETRYHRQNHAEIGQTPLDRWEAGWARLQARPAIPDASQLTEAFLWSAWRIVTKTATVNLHSNTYQVDSQLVGRKVELVFSPFDLETIQVRWQGTGYGLALPHTITRHTHPKAKPETPSEPAPATGIDYLQLTAQDHHEQIKEAPIGYHALWADDGQIAGQTSIDDLAGAPSDHSSVDTTSQEAL